MDDRIHLRQLIPRMRRHFNMWFAQPNIWCLQAYLDGFLMNSHDSSEQEFIKGFNEWIAKKYEASPRHSWIQNIMYYSGTNEHSALKLALDEMVKYSESLPGDSSEWTPLISNE